MVFIVSEIDKNITESIKSGEYFKDAREWYSLRYVHPNSHRSFLIMITIASVVMAIISINIFFTFLPLKEVVPIAIELPSKVDQFARLRKIGRQNEDPNESLIKYLIVRYIEAYENYDYEAITKGHKLRYLKESSSRNVFDKYKNFISTENPRSPVLRYKRYTKRIIEPVNINIIKKLDENGIPKKIEDGIQKITVKFRAHEYGPNAGDTTTWLAKIELDYSTVQYSREIKKFSPLNFKVKYYEVSQLSNE